MAITTEFVRRVWNDDDGVCFEIRPDQDGLGTVELHTPDDKSRAWYGPIRFSVPKDMAKQIGLALIAASEDAV